MIRTQTPTEQRSGIVLIAVLLVVVFLSLAAYHYSTMISAEYAAMTNFTNATQMRGLVESGGNYTAALLADPFAMSGQLGNNPYDNAPSFQDVPVYQDPTTGRNSLFSIVTLPRPEDIAGGGLPYRFGVSDENSKLNVNSLLLNDPTGQVGYNMLMQLPNMTADIANSILDWLDSSTTTPRPGGAKDEVYMGRSPPYHCKNGPLDSLEEMLLIQGVTPQLLFGNDRNRNGVLEPEEDDGTGIVDMGWQAYLTVFSTERNVDSTGAARTFLNNADMISLSGALNDAFPDNPEIPTFILAYRLYGGTPLPTPTSGSSGTSSAASGLLASSSDVTNIQAVVSLAIIAGKTGKNTIASLWDLVDSGVLVSIPSGRSSTSKLMASPFADPTNASTTLPILFDMCTTQQVPDLVPRINLATCPLVVLNMLANATKDATKPVLTADQITAIQKAQPQFDGPVTPDIMYTSLAGLLAAGTVQVSTLKTLDNYITTRSEVFRFQVVAYYDRPGPVGRAEAVVDTNGGRPRIVYWRDLSDLGPGFPLGPNASQ